MSAPVCEEHGEYASQNSGLCVVCGREQARAEIVAKLRERANGVIRDCGDMTHIASIANLVDKANDDLKTADWIEAGCPS